MKLKRDYIVQYNQQIKQNRLYKGLIAVAAILLTPLSLFVTLPLYFYHKRKLPIQKLKITQEKFTEVKNKRQQFNGKSNNEINNSKPKKILLSHNGNNLQYLVDRHQKERFNIFLKKDEKYLIENKEKILNRMDHSKKSSIALIKKLFVTTKENSDSGKEKTNTSTVCNPFASIPPIDCHKINFRYSDILFPNRSKSERDEDEMEAVLLEINYFMSVISTFKKLEKMLHDLRKKEDIILKSPNLYTLDEIEKVRSEIKFYSKIMDDEIERCKSHLMCLAANQVESKEEMNENIGNLKMKR